MASLNEGNVEKKLNNVNNTQDSIQTLSLWILHHKAHHEKIVNIWFRVLKKAKMTHRLTLFYLCNDVVQNCKKKHAIMYKDAFKEVLEEAALFVRDATVRPKIERIYKIWGEREIYDKAFIKDLVDTINNSKVAATANSKILADFKPEEAIKKISDLKKFEDNLELKRKKLKNIRVDASSIEAIKQLKDRSQGKDFCKQFEDSCNRLEEYVKNLQKEINDRTDLIEYLEQADLFYDAQYGEVKLVATAYKNFGARVNNQKRKLGEKKNTVLDLLNPSPVPSPSEDVPSPGDTPPNVEVEDMDLSEEEAQAPVPGSSRRGSTATTKSIPQPIPSVTQIRMLANTKKYLLGNNDSPTSLDTVPSPEGTPDLNLSPGIATTPAKGEVAGKSKREDSIPFLGQDSSIGSLESRIFVHTACADPRQNKLSNQSNVNWNVNNDVSQEQQGVKTLEEGVKLECKIPVIQRNSSGGEAEMDLGSEGGTPLNDEGGATPVQDEKSDPENTVPAPRENPIEFLTQLITQTRKTTAGSTSSTDLIQSLSMFTGSSKTERASPQSGFDQASSSPSESQGDSTPTSWAQWKAAQQQPATQDQIYNPPPPPPPPPPYAPGTSNSSVPYNPTSPDFNPSPVTPEQQQPNFPQVYTPAVPSQPSQEFNTSPIAPQFDSALPERQFDPHMLPPVPPGPPHHPLSDPNQHQNLIHGRPGQPMVSTPSPHVMQGEPVPPMPSTATLLPIQGGPLAPPMDQQRFNPSGYGATPTPPVPPSPINQPPRQPPGYGATPTPPVPPSPINQPPRHPMTFPESPMMGEPHPQGANYNPNLPEVGMYPTTDQTNVELMPPNSFVKSPEPPRGILKNSRPNLTTIKTLDGDENTEGQFPAVDIRPPLHPPVGGFRQQVPVDSENIPGGEDKLEFKEKLKRKTSISSPTSAAENPLSVSSRRNSNLTEIPREEVSSEKPATEQISSIGTIHRDRSPGQGSWKFDSRERKDQRDRDNPFRGRSNLRRSSRPYVRGRGSFESYAERARGFFMREGFPPPPPPPPEWPPYQQF